MTNTQRLAKITTDSFIRIYSLISLVVVFIQETYFIQTTGKRDFKKYPNSNI